MGWAKIQNFPEEYDGAIIGAPAQHWQKFRLAESWGYVVRNKGAQQTSAITTPQMSAATTAAVTACGALDGVVDGPLADTRECTWSAMNNVCGRPGAPAALNETQAAGIHRMWDGPRNCFGKRIWHAYDRGRGQGGVATTAGSTAQVRRYATSDTTFNGNNLYEDQESIDLAAAAGVDVTGAITYEDAALLVLQRTTDPIGVNSPQKLKTARKRGSKVIRPAVPMTSQRDRETGHERYPSPSDAHPDACPPLSARQTLNGLPDLRSG